MLACFVHGSPLSPLVCQILNKAVLVFLCNMKKICISVVLIIFVVGFNMLASFQSFRSLNQF